MVDIAWSFSPLPVLLVAGGVAFYVRMWRAARRRRDPLELDGLRLRCVLAAAALALVALLSPIGRLGEQMFSFHMLQHLLLLDAVPILLAFAVTVDILGPRVRGLRRFERRFRWVLHPAVVVGLYAGGMWLWHTRPLFELALGSGFWHAVQHTWLFLTGLLFWWYAVGVVRPVQRPRGMGVFMFVTSTKIVTGLLAAAILGSTLAHYPSYADAPRFDGLSLVEDRQLAGGLMLFEELVVMSIALTLMFVRMLAETDNDDEPASTSAEDRPRVAGSAS